MSETTDRYLAVQIATDLPEAADPLALEVYGSNPQTGAVQRTPVSAIRDATVEAAEVAAAAVAEIVVAAGNVASIAALRQVAILLRSSGYAVTVRGYYADDDGGGGVYLWSPTNLVADNGGTVICPTALTSIQAGRWIRVMFGMPPTPQIFGAKCDGVYDDALAIKACSDASKVVWFPPASYTFRSQVEITNSVSRWVGLAGQYPQATTVPGPRLMYHADVGSVPMILNRTSTSFSFLAIRGPTKGTGVGISNRRVPGDASYEDTDVTVYGCNFTNWLTAVEHYNRGLQFVNNTVGLCTHAARLYWDAANFIEDPGNPFDNLPEGFRAIRFEGNRFHLVSSVVLNIDANGEYLRGFKMIGNTLDAGDTLFYGSIYSGIFANNTIDQISTPALDFLTQARDVTITGNDITGDGGGRTEPFSLIYFRKGADNFTITGNKLRNASQAGILFSEAAVGGSITGNVMTEIGTPGDATRGCIRFIKSAQDTAICGNYFNPRADARCVRGTTAEVWSGVTIQGNAWNRLRTLASSYTDGGNNSIQS